MPNNNTYDQTDTRVNGTTEKEFEEWYNEDVDDHDIISLEYIGDGSDY